MCGGSRDDHLVMHMRPFADAAQNLGGLSQICVVSCHGLEMPPDMMDTGQTACLTGKRSCSEEPLSEKRARTGHCVGVHACIEEAAGDPRNPRIGKFNSAVASLKRLLVIPEVYDVYMRETTECVM